MCVRESERNGHNNNERGYKGYQKHGSNKVKNPRISSFLFFGFPEEWGVPQLWRLFKNYGWIADVYLARRRLRNKERFGFVRYRGVSDEKDMEKRINGIKIYNKVLRVFVAHNRGSGYIGRGDEHRNTSAVRHNRGNECHAGREGRDHRSFAEVVANGKVVMGDKLERTRGKEHARVTNTEMANMEEKEEDKKKEVKQKLRIDIEEGKIEYLKACLIGQVKEIGFLDNVEARLSAGGIEVEEVKMMGDMELLIKVCNESMVKKVTSNKGLNIHQWLHNVRSWRTGTESKRRVVWVNISGVPIDGWRIENFIKIAGHWGRVIDTMNCNIEDTCILISGKVLIQTEQKEIIKSVIEVVLNDRVCEVSVEEDRNKYHNIENGNDDDTDSNSNKYENSSNEESEPEIDSDEEEDINHAENGEHFGIPATEEMIGDEFRQLAKEVVDETFDHQGCMHGHRNLCSHVHQEKYHGEEETEHSENNAEKEKSNKHSVGPEIWKPIHDVGPGSKDNGFINNGLNVDIAYGPTQGKNGVSQQNIRSGDNLSVVKDIEDSDNESNEYEAMSRTEKETEGTSKKKTRRGEGSSGTNTMYYNIGKLSMKRIKEATRNKGKGTIEEDLMESRKKKSSKTKSKIKVGGSSFSGNSSSMDKIREIGNAIGVVWAEEVHENKRGGHTPR